VSFDTQPTQAQLEEAWSLVKDMKKPERAKFDRSNPTQFAQDYQQSVRE